MIARSGRAAGLALLFLLPGAGPVLACKCEPLTRAQAIERADAVFQGRAIAVDPEGRSVRTTFRVERRIKGEVGAEVIVVAPRSAAACGAAFGVGGLYTIAGRIEEGQIRTNRCLLNGLRR